MTEIRLAHVAGAQGDNALRFPSFKLAVEPRGRGRNFSLPSILISFFYIESFLKNQKSFTYRDWVLDSGAYSAMNSGAEISLDSFIKTSLRLIQTDKTLTEIFSLDVIGDWKKSLENTEKMWAAGVEAIPTFHVYEPMHALLSMARDYPKIAVGGVNQIQHSKDKIRWLDGIFSAVWPKKIHGFACVGERIIMRYPFHSVDSTTWEVSVAKFGRYPSLGVGALSVRGSNQNLRSEVEMYLRLEKKAQERWSKEMALLETLK